jgi:hypothetical protein
MAPAANIVIAIWAGSAAVLCFLIWRTPKPSEEQRATEAATRVGLPPQDPSDQVLVRNLEAELKDYAAMVADYYDTTGGNR